MGKVTHLQRFFFDIHYERARYPSIYFSCLFVCDWWIFCDFQATMRGVYAKDGVGKLSDCYYINSSLNLPGQDFSALAGAWISRRNGIDDTE